jgi:hypothetical protein
MNHSGNVESMPMESLKEMAGRFSVVEKAVHEWAQMNTKKMAISFVSIRG